MKILESGFKDKTGEPIAIGDMLQLHAKEHPSHKSLFVVGRRDGKVALYVPGTQDEPGSPGVALTQEIASVMVVVETARLNAGE